MAGTQTLAPTRTERIGRWAVTGVFFLNGLTLGSYLVRIPSLKSDLHLTTLQLGLISTIFGASALVAMQFVGALVSRFGSRLVIRVAMVLLPLMLVAIGLTRSFGGLVAASVAFGMVHGTVDVSMNAHAVAVERRLGRPIMNACHAAWSTSAVVASLVGTGAIAIGTSTLAHFSAIAGAVLVLGPFVGAGLLPATADRQDQQRRRPAEPTRPVAANWRAGWSQALVLFGLAGTALMVCEGATLTWGGVFLHDGRGASLATASLAITAFTGCQTTGRLVGDRVTTRLGAQRLFRAGALVGAAGFVLVVLSPYPAGAVAGFAVVGIGTSFLIPLSFSAAGHAGGTGPGAATYVARFTTFTYGGILVGPAAIGWVAGLIGLAWTLALLVPMLAMVALLTRLPGRAPA
jgi:MFS family permease